MLLLLLALACFEPADDAPSKETTTASTKAGKKKGKKKGKRKKGKRKAKKPPAGDGTVAVSAADGDAGVSAKCEGGDLVFPFWQGEYPSPLLQFDEGLEVRVSTSPCARATRTCHPAPGLYHPWAKAPHRPQELGFATRVQPETWAAQVDTKLGETKVPKGKQVVVLTYLSEGFCTMRLDGMNVEEMCPSTASRDAWKRVGAAADPLQFVQVGCQEGGIGWLKVDDALVANPRTREGEMKGYGEVGPAK